MTTPSEELTQAADLIRDAAAAATTGPWKYGYDDVGWQVQVQAGTMLVDLYST